jgi:hypothetical protein
VRAIDGPGICGTDFPLKVAALGESALIGYAEVLRPPGGIPNVGTSSQPRWPVNEPRYEPPVHQPAGVPQAPQTGHPEVRREPLAPPPQSLPRAPARAAQPVPLGPARAPLTTAPVAPVEVKPAATLACPIVSALDRWVADSVQPAAQRWLGQPVVEIRQISAYSCRGMNAQPGARISEHAFGNALDIAAFTLANGRRITVRDGWRGAPEEQAFLRDVHAGACNHFSTVLAPGSNAFHYDHMHVDLMRRSSGNGLCQPESISGDVIAARAARERGLRPSRGELRYTGTINARTGKRARTAKHDDEDDWVEDEPAGAYEIR